jgi:protein-disulfide isomerase
MTADWKLATLSGLCGAVFSLAVLFGAVALGMAPGRNNDTAIHDYLMAHPTILVDMSNKMQADQQAAEDAGRQRAVDKLGLKAFFDPRVAFVTGPADAKTTLIEFFDYNCPFCRASIPALQKFYNTHKNTARFAFIDLPIKGPNSIVAARAAIAARKQSGKYLKFHFALMNEENLVTDQIVYDDARKAGLDVDKLKKDMANKSVDAEIAAAHALSTASKVDGTPAFIINGRMREGALNDSVLAALTKKPG